MFLLTMFSAFAILALLLPARAELQHCALLGPDIPPPRRPSNSTVFQNAIVSIQKSISDCISSGNATFGMMDASSTSFSVDIFSQHEESLLDYHWDAPGLANSTEGVKEIDSHSLYRIGSISKLLTVYIFLISVGDSTFNEPITKYIPELATYFALNPASNNEIDITDWSSVTIGSLTSHLGGIPLGGAGDARADPADAMYLPPGVPLPTIISPIPGNISDDGCLNVAVSPCTRTAFFESITLAHPGLAPFHGPKFTTLFEENFILPLGLNETYYSNAPISQGVISHNDSVAVFSEDLIFIDPAGSYYSSSNDLRKIGQSILGSKLLSPAQTRRWMKPSTFKANDDMLVGAPWEIFKAPASSGGKTSWMYTKAGHIGLYYSNFFLLPDWDIGFTVLVAGDDAVLVNTVISDIIAAIAIPALEAAAKKPIPPISALTPPMSITPTKR
ncbi:uncharacterized protein PAC_13656 [Phialocephala subalpina]|uniref:Beta-lactamase-related domain-containing protein n=1 Tax=Phialocephala subalpina TaxID=576137 RepID=A0A1L7XFD7_9HELO|nr:uncharacterized protein PAC_13656 [Phialocephala subalpina]